MSRSSLSVSLSSEDALDGFTILPNHVMDNKALSGEAKLIVWYLLRKTKNWEVQLPHLQKEFKLGRDGIRRVFRELNENGYATLVNLGKGADGKWLGSRWQIHVTRIKPPPPEIKGVGFSGGDNTNTGAYVNTDGAKEEEWCRNQSPSAPDSRQSPFDLIREELSNPSKQRGGAAPEKEGCITPPAPNGRCVLTGWPTIEEFEDFLKERDFTDYICAKDQHEKFSNPKARLNFQNMRDWRGVVVRLHQRKMRDRVKDNNRKD